MLEVKTLWVYNKQNVCAQMSHVVCVAGWMTVDFPLKDHLDVDNITQGGDASEPMSVPASLRLMPLVGAWKGLWKPRGIFLSTTGGIKQMMDVVVLVWHLTSEQARFQRIQMTCLKHSRTKTRVWFSHFWSLVLYLWWFSFFDHSNLAVNDSSLPCVKFIQNFLVFLHMDVYFLGHTPLTWHFIFQSAFTFPSIPSFQHCFPPLFNLSHFPRLPPLPCILPSIPPANTQT